MGVSPMNSCTKNNIGVLPESRVWLGAVPARGIGGIQYRGGTPQKVDEIENMGGTPMPRRAATSTRWRAATNGET